MSIPRKNKKFDAFAITITKSPSDIMTFDPKDVSNWSSKFGEAHLVTIEEHKSGENHWHIYQEIKKESTTSDFKKKYWRAIIKNKKYEDRTESNMVVKPCNGFQGWIMYILKEYEPIENDNILTTSLSKDYIMKIHERQKEFVESKKFKTVSRAVYLNALSKKVANLNDKDMSMQEKVFEAHKRVLLVDQILPPGLKLEEYSWIVAEWTSSSTRISFPFCHLLRKLTNIKGFREEDNVLSYDEIEMSSLTRNPRNCIGEILQRL